MIREHEFCTRLSTKDSTSFFRPHPFSKKEIMGCLCCKGGPTDQLAVRRQNDGYDGGFIPAGWAALVVVVLPWTRSSPSSSANSIGNVAFAQDVRAFTDTSSSFKEIISAFYHLLRITFVHAFLICSDKE
jgi:hypothetical protein